MTRYSLLAVAAVGLLVSALVDRDRTIRALRIAWRRFAGVLPPFVLMLSAASLLLALVSPERIGAMFSHERLALGTGIAAVIGSAVLMPGFISFPLAGILLQNGVPYTVLAAFTVTLMLVGVATFPIERAYLGTRVAILRNVVSLGIALLVALAIGLAFGEIP